MMVSARTVVVLILSSVVCAACTDGPTTPDGVLRGFGPSMSHLSGFDCASVTDVAVSECEALRAFHASTNGDDWTDDTGWLRTSVACEWTGVICDGGRVTGLFLSRNHLTGTLPAELVELTSLEALLVVGNSMGGPIPPFLGNLSSLSVLRLDQNDFTGPIPPELGNLENLDLLGLSFNDLTGPIPVALMSLPKLRWIAWADNRLSGPIPPEIGNLAGLQVLDVAGNELTGTLPESLGSLVDLFVFDVSDNALEGSVPLPVAEVAAGAEARALCDLSENASLFVPDLPDYRALAGTDEMICGLPLTSPDLALLLEVEALLATGALNRGQGTSLLARLERARARAQQGRVRSALALIRGTIRQVEGFVAAGVLSPEEGRILVDLATAFREMFS